MNVEQRIIQCGQLNLLDKGKMLLRESSMKMQF